MNTIVGVHGDGETRREREAYGIDTLYRDAGGPEISPKHGDLGPIYSAMWRSWPEMISVQLEETDLDTHEAALSKYKGLGYEFVGDNYLGHHYFKRNIDQMQILIDNLKKNPFSRRHIISGWNPALLPEEGVSHHDNIENGKQALPPCHAMFQFFVEEMTTKERLESTKYFGKFDQNTVYSTVSDAIINSSVKQADLTISQFALTQEGHAAANAALDELGIPKLRLSCQLYQRSADSVLGVPFNIASYALLTMMMAQAVDMVPGEFIHTFGDLHIYSNHLEQVDLQLSRESFAPPKVRLNPDVKNLFDFKYEDIELVDYQSHDAIKAKVAV